MLVTAFLAFDMWNTGANMTTLRERAYPIPKTECANSTDCDQRALQIQAREAITADGAFDVALGQLILSFVGVVGVGFTVFYARLAWQAAKGSLEATGDTAQKQLRAYIRKETASISRLVVGATPEVEVRFVNCGQTPAHEVTSWIGVKITTDPTGPIFDTPELEGFSKGPLFPGEEKFLVLPTHEWSQADADSFAEGLTKIFVYGEIAYTDIFGDDHHTRFRLYHSRDRRESTFGTCADGNNAT